MSEETLTWLNQNTLIGFTEKRRKAWHFRADEQGAEPNHYPGAVPIEDVRRRLFDWEAVEGTFETSYINAAGDVARIVDPSRKTIVRNDTGLVLGTFKSGYLIHQHTHALLDQVEALLDDDVCIGSAVLLKGGAVAFVSLELPENITTPEGVVFRPRLLAAGSHDGSLSSTYKRVVTIVVCDNTGSVALGEHSPTVKVKHSRYSELKLASARETLDLIYTIKDTFSRQVADLTAIKVDDGAWARVLKRLAPIPESDGAAKTKATKKAMTLDRLWHHDDRVAPWKGTVYGVVQAVNTYAHHEQPVRGAERDERNAWHAVSGEIDKLDAETLSRVLAVVR
jgi:phage/plasmid-like protein (TIGR03299 family)